MENASKDGRACFPEHDGSCLCVSQATRWVLPTLYLLMFLLGLPGNVMSLWIFIKKIRIKTSTHIYLVNLGVSNLLLCLTMPFQAVYLVAGTGWHIRQLVCRIAIGGVTPLLYINIYMGVFILTWIALSRCALLVQNDYGGRPSTCTRVLPPAFFRKLQQAKFARVTCVATWLFVFSCVLPSFIYYSVQEMVQKDESVGQGCYSVAVEVGGNITQQSHAAAITLFCLCFTVVMASYIAVARHFIRSQRNRLVLEKQRVYSRAFRKIVVIQAVLIVCLLPYHVFKAMFIDRAWQPSRRLSAVVCHPMSQFVEIKNFLLCLAALRCDIDPIMYFLLDKIFRKNALDMFNVRISSQFSQTIGSNGAEGATFSQTVKSYQMREKKSQCPKDAGYSNTGSGEATPPVAESSNVFKET